MSDQPVSKPVPEPDDVSAPFFAGANEGKLMIQQCNACQAFLVPGSRLCTECLAEDMSWVAASGDATLFTFGVMHQKYHPGFLAETPYNISVVQLAEGPRLNTNVVDCANDDLKVGMKLRVVFEKANEKVSLPKFKPA